MAPDIFAKIGDIKGESVDSKHKDEIELLSWSWGYRAPVRAHRVAVPGQERRTSTISPSRTKSTRPRRFC